MKKKNDSPGKLVLKRESISVDLPTPVSPVDVCEWRCVCENVRMCVNVVQISYTYVCIQFSTTC